MRQGVVMAGIVVPEPRALSHEVVRSGQRSETFPMLTIEAGGDSIPRKPPSRRTPNTRAAETRRCTRGPTGLVPYFGVSPVVICAV